MKTIKVVLIIQFAILSTSCEYKNYDYPVALFDVASPPRYLFKLEMDASGSFSEIKNDVLQYRWDLNGDHLEWETDWLGSSVLVAPYLFDDVGYIGLQVKNSSGNITEVYLNIFSSNDYSISRSYSGLDPDFRKITYRRYGEDYYHSWMWGYDNIIQPTSDQVFNFGTVDLQADYGSLFTWDAAKSLDEDYYLPARADWQKMIDYCGGNELAGYNFSVDVEHGLRLTRAGLVSEAVLSESGEAGYYWTGDEADENSAYAVKFTSSDDKVEFVILDKTTQASVRLMHEHFQYFE